MIGKSRELPTRHQETTTVTTTTGGARYPLGPSNGRPREKTSAPGVAEDLRRQGAPEEEPRTAPGRAAADAAVHRTAQRRARDGRRRTDRVDARYSQAEKAAIMAKARSLNIAGANLVASATLNFVHGTSVLPGHRTLVDDLIDELAALRTQVARIGTNANQIAHRLNSGGETYGSDAAVLRQAEHTVRTVRDTIAALDSTAFDAALRKADR